MDQCTSVGASVRSGLRKSARLLRSMKPEQQKLQRANSLSQANVLVAAFARTRVVPPGVLVARTLASAAI
jgi:hypothetical protein